MLKKYNVNVTGNLDAQRTMVFTDGFGTDQTVWRYITPAFVEEYRLVLFDSLGHEDFNKPDFKPLEHYSLWDYVDDFHEIFNALELENVILVAHSISCMIGALMALKYPASIDKLVFISASPCYLNKGDYPGGLSEENARQILADMEAHYGDWIKKYAPIAMLNEDKPYLTEEFSLLLTRLNPATALQTFTIILKSDYREEIAELEQQVLIIQPRNDIFVPIEVGDYLHERIKNNVYYLINASGHFPHLSEPDLIIAEIKKFLASH